MKKIIIALTLIVLVIFAFPGCAASHAGHRGGGGSTTQHSGGCH